MSNEPTRACRVLALLSQRGPLRHNEIERIIGGARGNVGKTIADLRKRNEVAKATDGYTITTAGLEALRIGGRRVPTPPKSETRVRLPLAQGHMVPTSGNRDETCSHYLACLDAFIAAHRRSDPDASCPRGCRWYDEAPEERATDYASSGRTNMEASAYAGGV